MMDVEYYKLLVKSGFDTMSFGILLNILVIILRWKVVQIVKENFIQKKVEGTIVRIVLLLMIQIIWGGKMATQATDRRKQESKYPKDDYEDYENGKKRDKKQKKLGDY